MTTPSMGQVRKAVRDRIKAVAPSDLSVFAFIPDGASAPAVWLQPDSQFANFQTEFGPDGIEYSLLATFVVNRIDDESAQDALDAYLDPNGPIIQALMDRNAVNDTLMSLISTINVWNGIRYGGHNLGGTMYWGAQIIIKVLI